MARSSPDFMNAALFLIHLYNHSFSYFEETPFKAGPTALLFNLWQAAQFALKSFFPATGSASCANKFEETKTRSIIKILVKGCMSNSLDFIANKT